MAVTQIDPSTLVGFTSQAKTLVLLANVMGWSTRIGGRANQMVELRSPNGEKQLSVPSSSINANRGRSLIRSIVRHSEEGALERLLDEDADIRQMSPQEQALRTELSMDYRRHLDTLLAQEQADKRAEKLAEIAERHGVKARLVIDDDGEEDIEVQLTEVSSPPTDQPYSGTTVSGNWFTRMHFDGKVEYVCKDHEPEIVVRTTAGIGGHNRTMHSEATLLHLDRSDVIRSRVEQERLRESVRDASLVSRRPWLARRGGGGNGRGTGSMYPSGRVEVLAHDNGAVLYKCFGCDLLAENPRSISSHAGQMHPELPTGVDSMFKVTDYEPTAMRRRQSASTRLKRELLAALQGLTEIPSDPAQLADLLAEQVMANRAVDEEDTPPPTLSADEILARITRLVDRGQTAELFSKVDDLTSQVVDLTEQAEQCRARAERAEGNLSALRDMLNDAGGD